jgi:hypothetical protein
VIPQFIRDALKERMTMKERPELSAGKRAQLVARLDADLAQLGAELGVSLSCASWKERVSGPALEWKS